METNIFTRYATCFMLATLLSYAPIVVADFVLQAETNQITSSLMRKTMSRLSADENVPFVVCTVFQQLNNGTYGTGDIYYRHLLYNVPVGNAIQITTGPLDDWVNDDSGDFIVFT